MYFVYFLSSSKDLEHTCLPRKKGQSLTQPIDVQCYTVHFATKVWLYSFVVVEFDGAFNTWDIAKVSHVCIRADMCFATLNEKCCVEPKSLYPLNVCFIHFDQMAQFIPAARQHATFIWCCDWIQEKKINHKSKKIWCVGTHSMQIRSSTYCLQLNLLSTEETFSCLASNKFTQKTKCNNGISCQHKYFHFICHMSDVSHLQMSFTFNKNKK